MKIERIAAEQIKAVLDGYEEQIAYYSDRGDKMNVRYINGVRSGFCRALQILDVAGIEVDQVLVLRKRCTCRLRALRRRPCVGRSGCK